MKQNIIYRINELMGNQKYSLNEQVQGLGNFVDGLLSLLKKTRQQVLSNGRTIPPIYKLGDTEIDAYTFNRIKNALDDNDISRLNIDDIKKIGNLIRSEQKLQPKVDEFYNIIVGGLLNNKNTKILNEKDFIKRITDKWIDARDMRISFEEFLQGKFPNSPGAIFKDSAGNTDFLAISVLRDKIQNKVNKFIKDGDIDVEVRRKIPSNINTKQLTPSQIAKILKKIDNPNSTFWKDVTQLWKKSFDELEDEILQLSKGFVDDILLQKGNKEDLIKAYAAMISRKLDLMTIKNKKKMVEFLQGEQVPEELIKQLKEGDGWFEVVRNSRSAEGEAFKENIKIIFNEFSNNFTKKNLLGLINPKNPNFILYLNNSISQFFVTGQWGTLSSLWKKAIKMSPGESKTKLVKYIFASILASGIGYVVGAAMLTVINGLIDVYKLAFDEFIPTLKKIGLNPNPYNVQGLFREQTDLFKTLFYFLFEESYKGIKDNAARRGFETFFSTLPVIGMTQTYSDSLLTQMAEWFATSLLGKGQPVTAKGVLDFVYGLMGLDEDIEQQVQNTVPIATVDTPRTTTPSVTTPTTISTTPAIDSIPRNRIDSNRTSRRDTTQLRPVPGFDTND